MSRSVCWRAGRSRAPPVSSGSRRSRRASIACGGSSRIRAAASSIASGRPSRRWQISATAGAFSSVTAKSGADRGGALDEQRDRRVLRERLDRQRLVGPRRSRQRERRHRELVLAAQVQRRPAGHQDLQVGHGASRSATTGAAARTCSKLSSTSSRCFVAQVVVRACRAAARCPPRGRRAPGRWSRGRAPDR